MEAQTPKTEVLQALRVIFELGSRDIGVTESLISEVTGLRGSRFQATIVALRHLGLVQKSCLRLTLAGLAVAVGLPPVMEANPDLDVESAA
jgi:hypothetical protein